ncbi:MAG TPA: TRAM domain-containing protein, partial [Rectinemataceae bacterium]
MLGEVLNLRVQKMASGGEGLAFLEGQVVFLPYSIPGELCACRVTERAHGYLRAEILEILEPSPYRVIPPCPIFGRCGGCSLQHIAYEAQSAFKADAAREAFSRIAGFDPGPARMETGSAFGYRNRVQIHPCRDGGLGFMEAKSAQALRARGCPVAVAAIDAWLRAQNRKSKPWKELSARIGEKDRFVVFAQGDTLSVEGETAFGSAWIGDLEYIFPLGHFFQSNLAMTERLLDEAVSKEEGELALDLYSGAGLFAARLARAFRSIVLVESDSVSIEAARKNVSGKNARFNARNVESWITGNSSRP